MGEKYSQVHAYFFNVVNFLNLVHMSKMHEKKNAYSIKLEKGQKQAEEFLTSMRNLLQTYNWVFEIFVKSFNACSIFKKDEKDYEK